MIMIDSREQVMGNMLIEPSKQHHGQEPCQISRCIASSCKCVLSKITDWFASCRPCILHSVSAKDAFCQAEAKTGLNKEEKLETFKPIVIEYIQCDDLPEWENYANIEFVGLDDGLEDLDSHIQRHHQEEKRLHQKFDIWWILLLVSEKACDWLKCSYFVVELGIWMHMMAYSMEVLPIFVGETCEYKHVAIGIKSLVHKVMPFPDNSNQNKPCNRSCNIGLCITRQKEKEKENQQNFDRKNLTVFVVLKFFRSILGEDFPFQDLVEISRLKCKPRELIFTVTDIVFGQNLLGLCFVEMVRIKKLGDVVAAGSLQPVGPSRMLFNKVTQIVDLIVNNPVAPILLMEDDVEV